MGSAPPRSRRRREFTGCWKCRARKVKCDQKSPCSSCQRLGLECDSSSTRLVWVRGNESYRSTGRRDMHCERTWTGHTPLDSDAVDLLIEQCDSLVTVEKQSLPDVHYNPFSVFSALPSMSLLSSSNKVLASGGTDTAHASSEDKFLFHHYVHFVASVMMPFEHPWNPWKLYYPAVSLQYSLPEEKALYHALLCHAAFNLANLGFNKARMTWLAARNYNTAIQHLNSSFQTAKGSYSGILAAILTLMMAEVYSGQSSKWKHHLQGAWTFLLNSQNNEPWNESQFACFSTQSLLIVRIISGTCSTDRNNNNTTATTRNTPSLAVDLSSLPTDMLAPSDPTESDLIPSSSSSNPETSMASSILSTPQFGFTIGAQRSLLECISTITTVSQRAASGAFDTTPFAVDGIVSQILSRLEHLREQNNNHHPSPIYGEVMPIPPSTEIITSNTNNNNNNTAVIQDDVAARYQLNAFIYATYIYLYRSLLDVPPRRVSGYVSLTFENIKSFYAHSCGNLSLWPAFIAAVEAYTDQDMESAKAWLRYSAQFGQGNRLEVKRIVEEVWRRREEVYITSGSAMDRGRVGVDWREVADDLGVDILLV
ncbi:fungal-specific transcription factor domain-containing protein [Aspergillus bertholletiae]|uniref:Fungal-specific transcription factor domain-containing protein n=1 Tax=Aspergillus bertholletiae TaxID=1226010 RepID=A0A5N7ASJ8_9EURO|nr:fungal-specific transcription factor domain-containing protein [Aspergillus bertholletiae]